MATEPPSEKKEKKKTSWESVEGFASFLGKWAWIILIIEGLIFIIYGIIGLSAGIAAASLAQQAGVGGLVAGDIAYYTFFYIWYLIGGIATIILAILLVRPRFSKKWAEKDYDYLLNDVIQIGNIRIPTMLIIGVIIEIFLQFWGGLVILIPLLLLIFIGPKEYKWKTE